MRKIWEVVHTDIYVGDALKNNIILIKRILVIISFITFVMTCMNIKAQSWIMAVSTGGFSLLSMISLLIIQKTAKYRKLISCIVISMACVVFTYYFIIGGNDGFAALWIIIVPYAITSIVGMRYGVTASMYFLVLLILFCWTPLRTYLLYDYGVQFLLRFPVLYILSLLISLRVNYQLQIFNIKQVSHMDELKTAVDEERKRNTELAMQTIISIQKAVDAKDAYTNQHATRVAEYARLIARELGWSKERQEHIYISGLIHDIGKIGVPDAVLKKPGRLTDDEFAQIKRHPEIGYKILQDYDAFTGVGDGILYHHERYDGNGYPKHLKGKDIPEIARIIAVADAFDAMNSNRVYRKALDSEYIINQIREGKGRQFDPLFADVMLTLINKGKIDIG